MKFNIPIKVLIAFIGGFLIFVVTFFKFLNSTVSDIVTNAVNTVSQGVLISLEKKLTNTPRTNWSEIIKNSEENGIYVTSIGNLKFSSTQKDKLDAGEIISQSGTTYQFLNLVVAEITAYKKIGNTHYLLAYNFSNPTQSVNYYMMPAIKLIVEEILSKPENSWNEESIRLGKIYGFPVHVYSKMSALPNDIINSLSTRNLVFAPNKNTTQIGIIYYAFSGGVLKIGPLKYPAITVRITDV